MTECWEGEAGSGGGVAALEKRDMTLKLDLSMACGCVGRVPAEDDRQEAIRARRRWGGNDSAIRMGWPRKSHSQADEARLPRCTHAAAAHHFPSREQELIPCLPFNSTIPVHFAQMVHRPRCLYFSSLRIYRHNSLFSNSKSVK